MSLSLNLADAFIARPFYGILDRAIVDSVVSHVRLAPKYVFTTEATAALGKAIRERSEVIARAADSAHAPFERTWIELDAAALFEALHGFPQTRKFPDLQLGYLIDHDEVYVVANNGQSSPAIWPLVYHINQPWNTGEADKFAHLIGKDDELLDRFFWGTAFNFVDEESRRKLRYAHSASLLKFKNQKTLAKISKTFLSESAGDLRNVLAAMMALSGELFEPIEQTTPRSRAFSGGRLVQRHAHTRITHLHPRSYAVRQEHATSGVTRDLQRKRGHWAHDVTAREYEYIAGCVHDWIPADDFGSKSAREPDRYRCRVCGGKRWWRAAYERSIPTQITIVKP